MNTRSLVALGVVVVAVVGLGVYRSGVEAAPAGDPAGDPPGGAATEASRALPTLLDFGRGECIPCQQMLPVLDELGRRHPGRLEVEYLDLGLPQNQARAREYRIRVIPTQVLLDAEGREAFRHEGFWALQEIEGELEALGWTTEG